MNLYGFVGNDGVNKLDYLGLSPEDELGRAIEEARIRLKPGRTSIPPTGYLRSLERLRRLRGYSVVLKSLKGAAAGYQPSSKTIYIPSPVDPGLAIHELTHAFNHLTSQSVHNGFKNNPQDEGMAWLMQEGFVALEAIANIEDAIREDSCDDIKGFLPGAWSKHWADKWNWNSPGWGGTTYYTGGVGRIGMSPVTIDRNQGDFMNVQRILGANFSCSIVKEALNEILRKKGCCVRLSCAQISGWDEYREEGRMVVRMLGVPNTVIVEY